MLKVNRDLITNMTIGFSLADALGVPVEFKSREFLEKNPVSDMIGYGTYNQPPGTWSDVSSLSFCLMDILSSGYDINNIATKFVQWKNEEIWCPHGEVFDIGNQTRHSITTLQQILNTGNKNELELLKYNSDESTNGNGSLMRVLPLVFYLKEKDIQEQFNIVWQVSSLTHPHIRSAISCFIYLKFAENILEGLNIKDSYEKMKPQILDFFNDFEISKNEQEHFSRLLKSDISKLTAEEINSGGYVLDTLEASFWVLLNTKSYLSAVFKAINLGGDTDTTACVVGGVAGIFYGTKEVPTNWINKLAKKESIMLLIEVFTKSLKQ